MKREIFCSFCGKEQNQAYKIIASPNGDAYICNECVEVCQDVLKEKDTEAKKGEEGTGGAAPEKAGKNTIEDLLEQIFRMLKDAITQYQTQPGVR